MAESPGDVRDDGVDESLGWDGWSWAKPRPSPASFLLTIVIAFGLTEFATGSEPVTVKSLLREMTDPAAVARFPEPGYQCLQASSYNICSRTRSLDAVPFHNRLVFDMESSFGVDIRHPWDLLGYSAVTCWYAKPGATHNCPAAPELAARPIVSLDEVRRLSGTIQARRSGAPAQATGWPVGWPDTADTLTRLRAAPAGVVLVGGAKADPAVVPVKRRWRGTVCTATVRNTGSTAVRIARVDLFDFAHGLPGDTPFYAEAFQMLAQHGGTLAQPADWGTYADRTHYRIEEPEGLRTAHGMMLLRPVGADPVLLGFGSCRRFDGRISFDAQRLLVSFDGEGLELAPGQTWALEEFCAQAGPDRPSLLNDLCVRIEKNNPRRRGFGAPPMGWCSWYCFGPGVTVPDIRRNLDWIAANAPELRTIQIDDGYQPWMGDWLETGESFGGDIQTVLREIRERGFEPAIWVAPFVASPQSKLFRDHPDWFVTDADGKPLRSDRVGFGGWRLGPWYALDGTHPEARRFLETTFRTMRREWGCTYFKLDATYWGALHQGRFHDPKATRIEAYRRGMEAILRGAGRAFVLGCNHPMWPSLGLIDGSRSSMDTAREWTAIRDIGRQNLLRGWQNGRFWWNDPDCVLLSSGRTMDISGATTGQKGLPANEVLFHATTIHATGGMLLSGDDLPTLEAAGVQTLRQLIPPTKQAASFADETLSVGRVADGAREFLYLFNWSDQPVDRVVTLPRKVRLKDHWTGELLGEHADEYRVAPLPPRTARLIEAIPVRSQ